MAVGTDLRAGTDRGPGVDHGAATDIRADVDVRRHQDCIRRDERALEHGCRWHHARALLGAFTGTPVRALDGYHVVTPQSAHLDRRVVLTAEIHQHKKGRTSV